MQTHWLRTGRNELSGPPNRVLRRANRRGAIQRSVGYSVAGGDSPRAQPIRPSYRVRNVVDVLDDDVEQEGKVMAVGNLGPGGDE